MSSTHSWQFAASTLGVVEEDLPTAIAHFRAHDVRATELRSADGAFCDPTMPPAPRAALRAAFDEAGIEIFAVASRVRIAEAGDDDAVVAHLIAEMRLAADLGARFVRVFPGAPTRGTTPSDRLPELEEGPAVADERAARRLARTLDVAGALGVSPLVETHDSHPRGEDIARLLAALEDVAPGHPVGAIWDVLHPWRVGEELAVSAQHLLPHVLGGRGYVQIKDAASPSDTFPVLQGLGSVPTPEFLTLLDDAGYRGPVSLEWERFWRPDAPVLEQALAAARAVLEAHPPSA